MSGTRSDVGPWKLSAIPEGRRKVLFAAGGLIGAVLASPYRAWPQAAVTTRSAPWLASVLVPLAVAINWWAPEMNR